MELKNNPQISVAVFNMNPLSYRSRRKFLYIL